MEILAPLPLRWDGERLHVLDQTLLPAREEVLVLSGAERHGGGDRAAGRPGRAADRGRGRLRAGDGGRPRAVAGRAGGGRGAARDVPADRAQPGVGGGARARRRPRRRAGAAGRRGARRGRGDPARGRGRERRARRARRRAARRGAPGGARRSTVMTHCNSGALAASGRGTGLGVIAELADRRPVHVLACEARPLLQGARLTVWELRPARDRPRAARRRRGAGPAPHAARSTRSSPASTAWPPTATSRTRSGTYGLALAAHAAGVPFVAAGPSSSVDLAAPDRRRDRDRGARRGRGALRRRHAAHRAGDRGAATRRSTSRPPRWCGRW